MFEKNGVFVEFRNEAKEMRFESRKRGRPVYGDIVVVDIVNPQDKNVRIVRAATDKDKINYREAYQAFMNEQRAGEVVGTPLREWRGITRSAVREAAYYNILTVEQLADAEENVIAELGADWYELRKKAGLYIQDSDLAADAKAKADENERLRAEIDSYKRQLAEKETEAAPRRPGRPPRAVNQEPETEE